MFISPAYAQAGGGAGGDIFSLIMPIVMIMAIFWFLILRPQQKRMKEHQAMLANVRRGDTIVTAGGIVGKINKVVDETEVLVDTGEGAKLRIVKSAITEVRVKGEPAKS